MALSPGASALWGKTGAHSRVPDVRPEDWHPLACHMLDTAEVAGQLWDAFLAPSTRRWLSALCGGDSAARAFVCWLAGLHDLGKASPLFQSQSQSHAQAVRDAGLPVSFQPQRQCPPHATLSAHLLSGLLRDAGWPDSQASSWPAVIVGGHHGVFPPVAWRRDPPTPSAIGNADWHQARASLADLMTWHTAASPLPVVPPPPLAAQLTLAGLVIMSDWLASDELTFPYACGFDQEGYAHQAATRALRVPAAMGLVEAWRPELPTPGPEPARMMAKRFWRATARPVQRAAYHLAQQVSHPGLLLVEAPMGEGKTEAALLAAEVIAARNGANGLFVGLPSQATADQMFSRVLDWLCRQPTRPTVTLAHGKALRNEQYSQLLPSDVGGDEAGAGLTASQWLAGPKRKLLAPVVVGTVDQLLLAGVASRHVALRFLGLAGKVVVIDEVHAYDAYMSVILRRVLEWLGSCQVPVILLSATLPSRTKQKLLEAYTGGPVAVAAAAYPALTWVAAPAATPGARRVPEWELAESTVALTRLPPASRKARVRVLQHAERGEAEGCRLAAKSVAGGGCVLVLRNTVGRAQRTYRHLLDVLGPERVTLTHARFTAADRRVRDQRLIAWFGPAPAGDRPRQHVVVATQVAEQSLDVDFDLLISDLAPIDLLFQRVGRVHRHIRARPSDLEKPTMIVIGSEPRPDAPPLLPRGSELVYGRHLLLRTAAALLDRDELRLPDDIPDLVEQVYTGAPIGPPGWRNAMREAAARHDDELRKLAVHAESVILPTPGECALTALTRRDQGEAIDEADSSVQRHVRFGPPTIEVVLLRTDDNGTTGWTASGGDRVAVPLDRVPPRHLADVVLDQAIRLPAQVTDAAAREAAVPEAWRTSPSLSDARVLRLPADGSPRRIGGYSCSYSSDVGLEVTAP
jgi:CRISPR-associated endonuclease/helicase Cas3